MNSQYKKLVNIAQDVGPNVFAPNGKFKHPQELK